MKKIIAFALTLILLCSISSAFAVYPDDVPVIGSGTLNKNADDGIGTFTANSDTNVNVSVNVGAISHKYAVDVDFTNPVINLGGGFVWNVFTLNYDVGATGNTEDKSFDVKVYNYSDLPVNVLAAPTDGNGDTDFLRVDCDTKSLTEIAAVAPGAGAPTSHTVHVTVKAATADPAEIAATWQKAAQYYAFNKTAGTHAIGSCTLTISMVPTP